MLDVLREDYVRTARAKGVGERRVLVKHTLRNALIPIVTVAGLQLGQLMAGSIVLESVFALPGLGRLALGAISARDLPVVQGVVALRGLVIVIINVAVDLALRRARSRASAMSEAMRPRVGVPAGTSRSCSALAITLLLIVTAALSLVYTPRGSARDVDRRPPAGPDRARTRSAPTSSAATCSRA